MAGSSVLSAIVRKTFRFFDSGNKRLEIEIRFLYLGYRLSSSTLFFDKINERHSRFLLDLLLRSFFVNYRKLNPITCSYIPLKIFKALYII